MGDTYGTKYFEIRSRPGVDFLESGVPDELEVGEQSVSEAGERTVKEAGGRPLEVTGGLPPLDGPGPGRLPPSRVRGPPLWLVVHKV